MNKKFLPLFLLLGVSSVYAADQQWMLKRSTLTYHVSHSLHQTDGVSHAARAVKEFVMKGNATSTLQSLSNPSIRAIATAICI